MNAPEENLSNTPAPSPSPSAGQIPNDERIIHLVAWGLGLVCLAVGYLMLRPGMEVIRLARDSRAWPETGAQVTYAKSEYHYGGQSASSFYEPVVKYHYTVEGVPYEGDTIFFGATTFQNRSGKARSANIVSRYANHPLVQVRFNPARPDQSVLEPGASLRTLNSFGWALVFVGAGIALILFDLWLLFSHGKTAS